MLFFEIVDEVLDKDNHTMIYLATDSEEVKLQMRKRYGNRIISSSTPADRNSVAGIQDGLIDMYTLARTRKIYGSFQSSFSEMASQIGGVPIEILKKELLPFYLIKDYFFRYFRLSLKVFVPLSHITSRYNTPAIIILHAKSK